MPNPVTFAKLDVINQVLTALGENVLQNAAALAGTTKHALVMRTHYDAVVQFCFGKTAWRTFTSKKALNKLSGAPTNRWAAAWNLPTDMIKLLSTWPPSNYEIQNRQLLTNETSRLEVDYIRLVEEGYWPAWFTRFVVAELVMRSCRGVTGDAPDQDMKDERARAENDALFQDAQQQPNQQIQANDFIDVRY